jgi:hypothetical protein
MAVLFVSCGFSFGQDLTTGLVASYSFDEDVIDESENGNNGTLEGGAVVERGLLDLNGINSWVSFGVGVIPSQGNYSVAMQVNARSPEARRYQEILSQSGVMEHFYLGCANPNIRVSLKNVNGGDTGIPFANDGELHTLVYVINNDLQKTWLYYDGTLVKEYGFGQSLGGLVISGFRIGRQHSNFSEYFDGQIDNLLIYDRALEPSEAVFYDSDPDYVFSGDDQGPTFQIIEGNFTWQEAKADAEAKGGRLAVLDTQEKIDASNAYLQELGEWPTLLIGLTDEVVEGDWRWITGELLTVNSWGIGEPNNDRNEDYALIYGNSIIWNDSPIRLRSSYLLELLDQAPAAPFIALDPLYESPSGEALTIDATPTIGFPTEFTYQWTFNGFPVPAFLGGADATLSLNGTSDQNGTWRVQVTNSEGSAEASFEYRVFVDDDSDTLSNYREENITLTNPNLADSDSDGLSDPEEIAAETDPNIADTDEDGLSDGAEVNTYASNPKKKDTDDDGLSDGDEINTYLSNPNNSDSDSDGIPDASEVAAGLDLNTADTIASAVAFLTEELANRPDGFDEAVASARSAGQNDVTSNPSTYGLYGESAYNAIILERDARFLDSDEDGITDEKEAELETDVSSETVFYLQEGLDSATAGARAAGRLDVMTNPLDYALITKVAYDGVVTERDARPTQAESDAAVSQARVAGRSDVIIDPASYSLFSAEAYTAVVAERDARPSVAAYNTAVVESLTTGRSSVTNNPGDYGLYRAAAYNAVVAERDARPTLAQYSDVLAERDARPSVAAYNAVLADRNSRPTKEAYDTVVSERDARPTFEELKDGRLGSVILFPDVAENKVKLRFCIEESNGLGQWITREEEAEVDVPLAPGKKFFRFSVKKD